MKRKTLLVIAAAALALIVIGTAYTLIRPLFPVREEALYWEPDENSRTIEYNGHTYRYNSHLRTLLFLGIDTKDGSETHEIIGNGGRADVIELLIADPDTKTIRMLEISRDTMTKVDVYNNAREKLFSGNLQITLQYAYGDTPTRSSMLMKNKVSSILHDLPITAYCSLTIDGIGAAADLVGGVRLTFADDWTDIDPSYTAGATVTLDAEALEHFLRYRDHVTVTGNDVRMSRHSWFIREIYRQAGIFRSFGIDRILEHLEPHMAHNMDADLIDMLSNYAFSEEVYKLPGESTIGRHHVEYILDEDAVLEMVLQLFYRQVK